MEEQWMTFSVFHVMRSRLEQKGDVYTCSLAIKAESFYELDYELQKGSVSPVPRTVPGTQ